MNNLCPTSHCSLNHDTKPMEIYFYLFWGRSLNLLNSLKRHTELLKKLAFAKCHSEDTKVLPALDVALSSGFRSARGFYQHPGNHCARDCGKPASLLTSNTGHESFPSFAVRSRGRTLK